MNKIERKEMDRLQRENANLRYRLMESEKYHKLACRFNRKLANKLGQIEGIVTDEKKAPKRNRVTK